MNENILKILKQVLKTDSINENISQYNCEKWDSMNHLNIIIEIENAFNIIIEPEEISSMTDFQKIKDIIKKKIA